MSVTEKTRHSIHTVQCEIPNTDFDNQHLYKTCNKNIKSVPMTGLEAGNRIGNCVKNLASFQVHIK